MPGSNARIAIIGAGHAGLCVAGALRRRGVRPVMFDCADRLGDTWRGRYDGLLLNTHRDASTIPEVPVSPGMGEWPTRDEWADHIGSAVDALGVERWPYRVVGVRRGEAGGWLLDTEPIRSSPPVPDPVTAHAPIDREAPWDVVVVATGRNRVPVMPSWPGMDDTSIEVIHSSEYRNPEPFVGRSVLVVGAGNSGTEIAHLLSADGVATTISIRTNPVFARRELFGTNLTSAAGLGKHFPDRIIDVSGRVMQRLLFGRLAPYGIGPPAHRLSDVEAAAGATLDSGFVDDVKAGRISVVDAVERFERETVVTASGRRVAVDVVIAAIGSTPALDEFLPQDLLVDGWPRKKHSPFRQADGLYTAGLNPATLTSFHPDFIAEADMIADDIVSTVGDGIGRGTG